MCLTVVREPESKEGIGWKICHKGNKEGEWLPEWSYFDPDGTGGVDAISFDGVDNIVADVVYRKGETYKVTHDRKAVAVYGRNEKNYQFYPAGVHLYKKKPLDLHTLGYSEQTFDIIPFSYKNAVAEDDETIVAMEVNMI